jgi:hypothetical protein
MGMRIFRPAVLLFGLLAANIRPAALDVVSPGAGHRANAPLSTLIISQKALERIWLVGLGGPLDSTAELGRACPFDCVKLVWWVGQGQKLTIIMTRLSARSAAQYALLSLWQTYGRFGGRFYANTPLGGTNSFFSGLLEVGPSQHVAAAAHGPVLVVAIQRYQAGYFTFDTDSALILANVENTVRVQETLLTSAGYLP